ncbi:MAG: hypothetical protein HC866_01045 [Leptolyngbyaceae cyanobacterium RU_5_1]|nr:hypothetical protein [Leptolyngbyaceae cyanobacterium RU_5_1]
MGIALSLARIKAALTGQGEPEHMSDLNRGIMKFNGADSPIAIAISATLILGSIGILIVWALRSAYSLG